MESQNHRIIEWFGLEVTLKMICFQPPCHEQGHLPLDQVAQTLPGRGQPQLLWETCASVTSPSWWRISS